MPIYDNNLSDKQMKAGYWYVTHRLFLRKVGVGLLVVLAAVFLIYGIWGLFNYYVLNQKQNAALVQSLTQPQLNYALLSEINQPQPLQILETKVFRLGGDKFDLVATVVNPNQQWNLQSFDYSFSLGGSQTPTKTDFILPQQTKYVLELGFSSAQNIAAAQLIVQNLKWQKVSNFSELAPKIIQLEFANQRVLTAQRGAGGSSSGQITNVQFDIYNKSPYSFWEPRFVVLLYRGKSLLGVTIDTLPKLDTMEKKSESLNLFQELSGATSVEIVPDINILDSAVFKGFDRTIGEEK